MPCNHAIDSKKNIYEWIANEPSGVTVTCLVCDSSWFFGKHGTKQKPGVFR